MSAPTERPGCDRHPEGFDRSCAYCHALPAAELRPTPELTPEQAQLLRQVRELERTIELLVPSNVVHWAVEQARRSLSRLASNVQGVKTHDTFPSHERADEQGERVGIGGHIYRHPDPERVADVIDRTLGRLG